ncbi:hypothetical protein FA95DRAFT_1530859 [Auriscalpium vulgare]|uniref:Uncharacterized protein n=1 Tax=Auriscalpium vulgare TaxID=40419 RepID=A0ACB8SBG4_9AGAM|nr:hypothetical protein FA95DRAFT_1530859 [Auriscalpium vulgare]
MSATPTTNPPVKTEGETSTPAPPQTPYTPSQWSTAQIPIDPALQQHPTTPYYPYQSHYPQASYGHYQPYIPPPQTAQPQTPTPIRQPAQPAASQLDTADVATLNDALGSAGVDLRAEEETLQRSSDQHQAYRSYEDRSRKQPPKPNIDTRFVGPTMRTVAAKYKVARVPDDAVNYVALALRTRLQDLLTAMIAASHHRTDTQFDREPSLYPDGTPMWSVAVRGDVAKQLAALERAEREDEMRVRRERKELAAAQAAALAAVVPGAAVATGSELGDELEGPKKKKKKTDGPGVTAKNMSEDVRKKMSNAVASQAAGLGTGKYAWMNASHASSTAAKAKAAAATAAAAPAPATTTAPAPAATPAGTWSRPYVLSTKNSQNGGKLEDDDRQTVTMRDALFVVEKEKGHGGGRGAARGWV